MNCCGLGLSSAAIVFLAVSESAAQNAAPPPAPTETTAPPQTVNTETPAAPTINPPSPAATNPAATNPAAPPPHYQVPYPSYGYPNPHGGYGWDMPPKELAYNGQNIPRGYLVEVRYNRGLLIAGASLFGLAYALTAYSASEQPGTGRGGGFTDRSPWDALYIPIAGPFAFANHAPDGSGFIYVFEGLGQVTGIGLFLLGILRPKEMLVRQDTNEAFRPQLHIGPGQMKLEMRF